MGCRISKASMGSSRAHVSRANQEPATSNLCYIFYSPTCIRDVVDADELRRADPSSDSPPPNPALHSAISATYSNISLDQSNHATNSLGPTW